MNRLHEKAIKKLTSKWQSYINLKNGFEDYQGSPITIFEDLVFYGKAERKILPGSKHYYRLKIRRNPTEAKWYLGLTKDFRTWKILHTKKNPNDAFEDRYVWFYGPYETREEAERFKKQEKLNPRKKR